LPVNVNSDFVKSMYDMLTQFATGGIKILLMINGGAAVAVLAFLGNLVGKTNMDVSMMIRPLAWSMIIYTIGVIFAAATALEAYYCQLQFTELRNPSGAKKTRYWAMVTALLSIASFAVGCICTGCSIGVYFFM
jgi:hypothetical protein